MYLCGYSPENHAVWGHISIQYHPYGDTPTSQGESPHGVCLMGTLALWRYFVPVFCAEQVYIPRGFAPLHTHLVSIKIRMSVCVFLCYAYSIIACVTIFRSCVDILNKRKGTQVYVLSVQLQ